MIHVMCRNCKQSNTVINYEALQMLTMRRGDYSIGPLARRFYCCLAVYFFTAHANPDGLASVTARL